MAFMLTGYLTAKNETINEKTGLYVNTDFFSTG